MGDLGLIRKPQLITLVDDHYQWNERILVKSI
jgi:hypothetical protein